VGGAPWGGGGGGVFFFFFKYRGEGYFVTDEVYYVLPLV